MKVERVRPSNGQGRYAVIPPTAPDIVALCALQIRLPHHTIGGWHPWRLPPNAASVEEQDDDHCGNESSRFISFGNGRFDLLFMERRVHLLQPRLLDGRAETETADESSPCSYVECVVRLSLCGTQISLVVS